jgi:hypothetical protein
MVLPLTPPRDHVRSTSSELRSMQSARQTSASPSESSM